MYKHLEPFDIADFADTLIQWSKNNPRILPWKEFRDPYSIWISEIILQQTRVQQGLPYFLSFIEKFPNIQSLASASEDEVLREWEGLGYYSRARNLRIAALQVMQNHNGIFPNKYRDILALKGIGPYTAAAIASFAYELPYGVVDGNVKRVVSRIFGITQPIDQISTIKDIQQLVDEAVQFGLPSAFNQAIMDFGATACKPHNPACGACVFNQRCVAYLNNNVDQLPFKSKRIKKESLEINLAIYIQRGRIMLTKDDTHITFWKGLYTFPSLTPDQEKNRSKHQLIDTMDWVLTHRKLTMRFYKINENTENQKEKQEWITIKSENLKKFALPRPLRLFLNKNSCNLGLKVNNDQQSNIDR